MSEERFQDFWQDATMSFSGEVSQDAPEPPYPAMVHVELGDLNGTILSDDARSLAALLTKAADACDKANEAAFATAPPDIPEED